MSEKLATTKANPIFSLWGTWFKALTQPNKTAFKEITNDPNSSLAKAVISLAGSALIGGVFFALVNWLFGNRGLAQLSDAMNFPLPEDQFGLVFVIPLIAVSVTLSLAFVGTALVQMVSKILGGMGSFDKLFYCFSAFLSPLWLAAMLFSAVPYLSCLIPPLVLYGFVLSVIAAAVTHQFGTGKALAANLSAIFVLVLICIFFYLLVAVFTLW